MARIRDIRPYPSNPWLERIFARGLAPLQDNATIASSGSDHTLRDVSPALRHGVLLILVLLAGGWLRVRELAVRPMHADEANQAVKVGRMLEGEGYRFDPTDHHGPTLYHFGLLAAKLRGEGNLRALTETTVRLVPAFFGTLSIAMLWRLASPLGLRAAFLAALFLAISPPATYFSRYFIQETLLACFTLGALVCGQRLWTNGGTGWAVGMGLCAGLMQATKASALLFAAAALLALIIVGRRRFMELGWRPWVAAVAAALVTAALFYSSFGSNLPGLRDALGTFGPMLGKAAGGATGHEKPWWYYGGLFIYRRTGGYVWDQTWFFSLAMIGGVLAFRNPPRLPRVVALATTMVFVVLSLTPYKTPWIVVNLVPGLCLLAGYMLARVHPFPAGALALAAVLMLGWQNWQAVFLRPADSRNPYAYVHSSPDVRRLAALAAAAPPGPVKVISPEYWPLPWYLRGRDQVGYWTSPPEDCDGALVIVAADLADDVQSRLKEKYQTSYRGLRPGFVLVVFTPAPVDHD